MTKSKKTRAGRAKGTKVTVAGLREEASTLHRAIQEAWDRAYEAAAEAATLESKLKKIQAELVQLEAKRK